MKKTLRRPSAVRGVAAIRQQYGCSQAIFAQLLGIPKSTLSMAECGRRSLPVAALLKLGAMELERVAGQNNTGPQNGPR